MILLFDGTNIACRHASFSPSKTARGIFLECLELMEYISPAQHYKCKPIFVWDPPKLADHESNNYRKTLQDTYKKRQTPRSEKIKAVFTQKEFIKKYLKKRNIRSVEQPGLEADDLIAFSVAILKKCEIIIVSDDKDFLQLVNSQTSVIRNNQWIQEYNFEAQVGVKLEDFAKWKAVLGDISDNIPQILGKQASLEWIKNGGEITELTTAELEQFHQNQKLISLQLWNTKGAITPATWRNAHKQVRKLTGKYQRANQYK